MPQKTIPHRLRWLLITAAGLAALPLLAILFFSTHDAIIGITHPYQTRSTPNLRYPDLGIEWQMHPVDNPGDWLPNGLDATDINADGFEDYVTNYEFRGRIRVAFHPGTALTSSPWQAVTVVEAGRIPNAESAAAGDLDEDGHPDLLVAHGVEHTDLPPGIRILWGLPPDGDPAQPDSYRWQDGGDLPASAGGWQFLYLKSLDLDNDGDMDILAGGRATRIANSGKQSGNAEDLVWAGLRWFVNPAAQGGSPRSLDTWHMRIIDAKIKSGHGFVSGDLDGDGFLDLVINNADWDTPEEEESIAWYRNPGGENSLTWQRYELLRSTEFYGKEQVVIADLDTDGMPDILGQSEQVIHWLRNRGLVNGLPVFEALSIPKHRAAQWRSRPLLVADLNQDGRADIIGASIHRDGQLPPNVAAVYWMEQTEDGWQTHIIKWGDGFWGLGTFNGEKWDQMLACDVDGDGDLDLVANVEEYNRLRSILSVVWFENPLN